MTREFNEPDETPSVNVIDMFHSIQEGKVSFLDFCDWLEEIRAAAVAYGGK